MKLDEFLSYVFWGLLLSIGMLALVSWLSQILAGIVFFTWAFRFATVLFYLAPIVLSVYLVLVFTNSRRDREYPHCVCWKDAIGGCRCYVPYDEYKGACTCKYRDRCNIDHAGEAGIIVTCKWIEILGKN